jgi:hypothetical protein
MLGRSNRLLQVNGEGKKWSYAFLTQRRKDAKKRLEQLIFFASLRLCVKNRQAFMLVPLCGKLC